MPIKNSSSFKAALLHPLAALQFRLGNKEAIHTAIILDSVKHLWGSNANLEPWKQALQELADLQLVPPTKNETAIVVGNNLNTSFGKWIYCCVRVLKPEYIIETGVAHGYSSWIILNALHKNQKGTLYSIDMPNNDTNENYNFSKQPETGWMVPDQLRSRWKLNLGDAKVLLPAILNELGAIDIFFHDSDHSFEHMKFEFEVTHPHIRKGGLLLSDDVHKNAAFREHVDAHNLTALQFNKGGAAIHP